MNAPAPIQETAAPPYTDPYRPYWLEVRAYAIGQIRLLRLITRDAPPDAAKMHSDLIATATATVRAIERGIGCQAWSGT